MTPTQIAAKLRLGEPVDQMIVAQELDRLVAELVALQLWQHNLLERIRRIPNKSMSEGYHLMRREDVVRAIDRRAVEIEPDEDDDE